MFHRGTITYLYRETLLGQLLSYIKSLKEEFNSCSRRGRHAADGAAPPTGKNLPGVVNNVVWARQLQAKVSNVYLKALINVHTSICILAYVHTYMHVCEEM